MPCVLEETACHFICFPQQLDVQNLSLRPFIVEYDSSLELGLPSCHITLSYIII